MKYDLHVHTNISRCSNMKPELLLKAAKKAGLDGVGITDHNTIQGGLAVKKANASKDFEVIVGAEIMTPHAEVIGLNLNEEIRSRELFEVIDEIRAQGGIAVIAHPTARFRQHIRQPCLELQGRVDAIEGFNSRAVLFENSAAQRLAVKFGFAMTGGSDAHFCHEVGKGYTLFDGNLAGALKKGTASVGGSMMHAVPYAMLSKLRKFVFK